jgi:hypothetical protein
MTACTLVGILGVVANEVLVYPRVEMTRAERRTQEWHRGQASMHGLIGDRFLKRFVGGILRRRKFTPTSEMESEGDDGEEMMSRSDEPENEQMPGKEELGNIEKIDKVTERLHQAGGLDRSSGVTQPPDGL